MPGLFPPIIFSLLISICKFGDAFILSDSAPLSTSSLSKLAETPLRLASMNIQVFGPSKFRNTNIRQRLSQILSRYDVIVVMEIRDSSNTVFEGLRQDLNAALKKNGVPDFFNKVESGRLGRTNTKEQYGFLYRNSRVNITSTYQVSDTKDLFEREPYAVRIKCPSTVIQDFGVMVIHTTPTAVREELDNLTAAYNTVRRHWHLNDILIVGDFNADCNYFKQSEWTNVSLRADSRFTWLIGDNIDTTVADSDCAYDRFVAAGDKIPAAVFPGSVKVFRFDEELGMSKSEGLTISDHYPIELQFRGLPNTHIQSSISTSTSYTVKDSHPVSSVSNIRSIYQTSSCAPAHFHIQLEREASHMHYVSATMTSLPASKIMSTLLSFQSSCRGTLSDNLLSVVEGYVNSLYLQTAPNVYGLIIAPKNVFDVSVTCYLQSPYTCEVSVSRSISG